MPQNSVDAIFPGSIFTNAGYGIRTRELLRDGILSPAPLASLANPAKISDTHAAHIVLSNAETILSS